MNLSEMILKSYNRFVTECINKLFSKRTVQILAVAMLSAYGLSGIPQAAHAGIEAKVGTFTLNSGTGTQSITGVGFQPKAYILFYTKNDTDDMDSNGMGSILSIGMTDGTNQFCMASGSEDNQGTTDVGRRGYSDVVLATHDAQTDQLVEGEASHVSMDSDGFTISITTPFTAPAFPIVHYIAFGGDDLLATAGSVDLADTVDTSVDVTAPGFEPDVIITSFIGHFLYADGNTDNDDHSFSIGWAVNPALQASNNTYSVMVASQDNQATSHTISRFDNTRAGTSYRDGAIDVSYDIGNFNSSGFSVTTRLAAAAANEIIGYLALKLGSDPNVYSTARTARTSIGDDVEAAAGFQPIFLFGIGSAAASSFNTNTNGCSMAIGMTDGTDTYAIVQHDEDGISPSNTHNRVTNTQFMTADSPAGGIDWEATFEAFNVDGWTINYGDSASAAYQNGFLAIGAGGPTVFTVNPTSMNLMAGEIETGTVYGGTSPYTASTSNSSVATVSVANNTFTVNGVSAGTATITIGDGAGASSDVVVTITEPLTASPANVSFYPGQTATVIISGGTPGYTVSSGNPAVVQVSVSGDTVTILAVGGGTITVTITDMLDKHAYVTVTVGETITPGLGNCPVPPFTTAGVGPNVLLVLDHSGSMGQGATLNGSEWELSRWETAKTVFKKIINDNPNIQFGLMRLDGSNFAADLAAGEPLRQGGKLLRPCGTPGSELIDYIDNWGDLLQSGDPGYRAGYDYRDSNDPQTWTVLAETLASAGRYFSTVIDGDGNRAGKGPAGFGYYKAGVDYTYNYDKDGDSTAEPYLASLTDDLGNTIVSTSPISSACQKTFIIFLTDGESNYDSDWDVVTDVISDYDNDNDPDDCKNGDTGCSSTGRVEYFDDVAKYLYENDMRSDLPEKQNIITYVIGFGFDAGNVPAFLEDTADNGGGQFFLAQNDTTELTTAMQSAIQDIMAKISSGTAVATITTSSSSDDYLIRGKFFPGSSWRGYLERFTLPYHDTDTADWEAGALLNNRVIINGFADRKIYTFMSLQSPYKQAFTSADGAVKTSLSGLWGLDFDETADMIDYIRGDTTNDGVKYKDRNSWLMGDIIYSTPVAVGPPKGWYFDHPYKAEPPEYASYQAFKSANSSRKSMIYVGANDGMLHAFDSNTGQEDWAFIPEKIHSKLTELTVEDCHKYYVDLTPYATDVWDGSKWLTLLIGGNRFGGEEYFALDVTDPAHDQFSALWDVIPFPGKLSSTVPVVGKVKATGDEGDVVDEWVAIITSGYHNSSTDLGEIAALSVTDGSKLAIWDDGDDEEYATALSTQAKDTYIADSPYYTLTSPSALDSDMDGYLDLIYAGDTEGSLWKFYYDYATDGWKKVELFNTGGQPITAPPALAFDFDGNLRIYFGTGKYLEESDKANNTRNAFYCLVEKKQYPGNANDGHYTSTTSLTGQLQDLTATVTKDQFDNDLDAIAQVKATDKGWYFQLDIPAGLPGERVLGKALVVSGVVFFTSFVPNQDVCGYGGDARLYAIDYIYGVIDDIVLTGLETNKRYMDVGVGIPSEPVFYFDPETKTARLIIQKSDADVEDITPNLKERPMLIQSWRAR
jgi:type IV pilus assembly protein PilY1